MHRYTVDGNGNLHAAGGNIEVPKKTQGLLVLPNYFVFSTSSPHERSNIYVVKRGYPNLVTSYRNGNLRCVRLPRCPGVAITATRLPALRVRSRLLPHASPTAAPGAPTRVITHLYARRARRSSTASVFPPSWPVRLLHRHLDRAQHALALASDSRNS